MFKQQQDLVKKTSQRAISVANLDDNLDFSNFSLGIGSVQEKKQRLS